MKNLLLVIVMVGWTFATNASQRKEGILIDTTNSLMAKATLKVLGEEVSNGNIKLFIKSERIIPTNGGAFGTGPMGKKTYTICAEFTVLSNEVLTNLATIGESDPREFYITTVGKVGCE